MPNPRDTVEKYHSAFARKDYASARECLVDNLFFKGAIDTFNDADQFMEAIEKLGAITRRTDVKKFFVDGDDVCILYDLETSAPAEGTHLVAEWFQVKGGKIAAIRAIFDARPFLSLAAAPSS